MRQPFAGWSGCLGCEDGWGAGFRSGSVGGLC